MNLARLAKVWKLTTSPSPGEAAAARERARVIVEREGKTLDDVPSLLRTSQASRAAGAAPSAAGFTFYDMNNSAHRAAYTEWDRKRRSDRARREAPERAEVLARYCSLDAVLAWTEQEQLLRAAVARWSVFQEPPHERWTRSIDGYKHETIGDAPVRVIRALSEAYPLPATITEAAAEYAAWERRDRDIRLAIEDTSDTQLDLPAYLRREIVRRLLETELRATSIDEVLIRQRHLVASEMSEPEIERAVLRDLEGLVQERPAWAVPKRKAPLHKNPTPASPPEPSQFDMFG